MNSAKSTAPARRVTPPLSGSNELPVYGLLILAVGYTLYLAAELLIPVAFAIFLNILLSPAVRRLARIGIKPVVSAAIILVSLVGLSSVAVSFLAGPAERWLAEAPTTVRELKSQMLTARSHLEDIQELAEEVEEIAQVDAPSSGPQSVVVEGPGLLEGVLGGLPSIAASAAIVVFLTFFLLASGDTTLRRFARCARTWSGRRRVITVARDIQSDLSRYLATVTIINILLGATVAAAMTLLNVPNPLLWGAMVGALNFAPYLGSLVSVAVLAIVGITSFPTIGEGLVVPAVALMLTSLEGHLVTPAVLGRRMSLNPTVIFVSVLCWGWLWGVAGALMAVPIMTSLKVWLDHMPAYRHLGTFLRPDDWDARKSRVAQRTAAVTRQDVLQAGGNRP